MPNDPQFVVVGRVIDEIMSESGKIVAFAVEGHDVATPNRVIRLQFWRHAFIKGAWLVRHNDRCASTESEFDTPGRRLGWSNELEVITCCQLIIWFWRDVLAAPHRKGRL